jgi:hypothetical protein
MQIRLSSSSTPPIINDLSGHDAHFLTINNVVAATYAVPFKQRTRKINNETIAHFQLPLKNKTWDSVYKDNDATNKFNSFLLLF